MSITTLHNNIWNFQCTKIGLSVCKNLTWAPQMNALANKFINVSITNKEPTIIRFNMTRVLGGIIFWWNIRWNLNRSPLIKLVCAFHQLKNCLFTSSTIARVVFPTLFIIIAKNQLGRWHQQLNPQTHLVG
jgi:hypothetical protein